MFECLLTIEIDRAEKRADAKDKRTVRLTIAQVTKQYRQQVDTSPALALLITYNPFLSKLRFTIRSFRRARHTIHETRHDEKPLAAVAASRLRPDPEQLFVIHTKCQIDKRAEYVRNVRAQVASGARFVWG